MYNFDTKNITATGSYSKMATDKNV